MPTPNGGWTGIVIFGGGGGGGDTAVIHELQKVCYTMKLAL